jgi:hypothetical protein
MRYGQVFGGELRIESEAVDVKEDGLQMTACYLKHVLVSCESSRCMVNRLRCSFDTAYLLSGMPKSFVCS